MMEVKREVIHRFWWVRNYVGVGQCSAYFGDSVLCQSMCGYVMLELLDVC